MRRAPALALLLALAAGCSGGAGDHGAHDRLARIVLSPLQAPAGTRFVEGVSGFQDLEAFARDAAELAALRRDGFVLGHLALFLPAHRRGPLRAEDPIVQGIAGAFATPFGARRALARFVVDLRERQLPGAVAVPPPAGLGPDAVGLRGRSRTGAAAFVLVWRQDALVLAVSGQGSAANGPVEALAAWVAARARASAPLR